MYRRYIELPTLTAQEDAEELRRAIEHLNEAHILFAQDRYREAVQRCRQARACLEKTSQRGLKGFWLRSY